MYSDVDQMFLFFVTVGSILSEIFLKVNKYISEKPAQIDG